MLTKATLSEQFLRDMKIGENNNHKIGGELALLAFAKKGGEIRTRNLDPQAFIISPQSLRGIKQFDKMVILLSTGVATPVESKITILSNCLIPRSD